MPIFAPFKSMSGRPGRPSRTARWTCAAALALSACQHSGGTTPDAGSAVVQPARPSFDAARLSAVRTLLEQYVADESGGIAVGIQRGDGAPFVEGFGMANNELRDPVSPHTVFEVGSVTKQLTAMLVLRAAEAGLLSLDDDIRTHLPAYPAPQTADGQTHTVHIAHLLAHTSGIPSFTNTAAFQNADRDHAWTRAEVHALFEDAPLQFAPGDAFRYSNSGYYLLGEVLEAVHGQPYTALLDEMFTEVGLEASSYCDTDRRSIPRATGYAAGRAFPSDNMQAPFSAGAACMTATDLLAWVRALHGHGSKPVVTTDLSVSARLNDGRAAHYANGLFISRMDWRPMLGHGGNITGFTAESAQFTDEDTTVVLLTNRHNADLAALLSTIATALFGPSEAPPLEQPMTAADAEPLLGDYTAPGLPTLRITWQDAGLTVQQLQASPPAVLTQRTATDFVWPGTGVNLRFISTAEPVILEIEQRGTLFDLLQQAP